MLNLSIYLRPLRIEDAEVSYQWRNNPKIWRYTSSRPDTVVTLEMEKAWLESVMNRENEKRFAICLKEDGTYIGNIFFTDIKDKSAMLNIFIGDMTHWGRQRAMEAVILIGIYGFKDLQLETIVGIMDKRNQGSAALARNFGSCPVEEFFDESTQRTMTKWIFTKKLYEENYHFTLMQNRQHSQKEI